MSNSRLIELLIDCTVRIGDRGYGGTGFFVAPGTILTCAHVVQGKRMGDAVSLVWKTRRLTSTVREVLADVDVAVLETAWTAHPCVRLSPEWELETPLYGYGYPVRNESVRGESIRPEIEGETHPDPDRAGPPLLRLAHSQIEPGFSGAPLLNRAVGSVCGIVKSTRDRASDLGGRAIPWGAVEPLLPRVAEENRRFHGRDTAWRTAVALQGLRPEVALTRGIQGLAGGIRRFVADYIGTAEEPEPFGGRAKQIRVLDRWLETDGSLPYFLVTAPAGRGKSALLVHWCRKLLERDAERGAGSAPHERLHVVFIPVSIRYRTNLASFVFSALSARLAEIHGETLPRVVGIAADEWRGIAASYLDRPLADGSRVLVVIDGLDEAADWQPGPDLFPLPAPAGVRVVVSARLTDRRPLAESWLRTLGWHRSGTAQQMALAPLTRRGLADVLVRMGVPLDQLASRNDVVAELFRLTEGDPLLLSLYVKDLWKRGEAAARIDARDLHAMRPGLHGYFEQWWEDQRQLWKEHFGDKAPLREKSTALVLKLLACALGPLRRRDLLRLGRGELEQLTFHDAVLPLERFIVNDGSGGGFVFAHPRLAEYHYGLLEDAGESGAWDARFLAWGQDVVEELASGALPPRDAPPYVVQYHGAHLDRADADPSAYVRLLSGGWARAWYEIDKTYSGLLSDVQRVWLRLERSSQPSGEPRTLHAELLCALVHASVASLAQRVSPALLARLVAEGIHTEQQVRVYAERMLTPEHRASALMAIARVAPPEEREGAYRSALAAVEPILSFTEGRAFLEEWLDGAPDELLAEALPLVSRCVAPPPPFTWMELLLRRVPDAARGELVALAGDLGRWVERPPNSFLLALAERTDDDAMPELIAVAGVRLDDDAYLEFLTELAPSVRPSFLAQWYRALRLKAVRCAESNRRQAVARGGAHRLWAGRFRDVLVSTDVAEIAEQLSKAIAGLPPGLLPALLELAPTGDEATRVATLLCLGGHAGITWPVLPLVSGIMDARLRCDGCAAVAHVAEGREHAQLEELIASAPAENARARALCSLAIATGSRRSLGMAVRAVRELPSPLERAAQLVHLAGQASGPTAAWLWRRALSSCARVGAETERAGLLIEMAALVPIPSLERYVAAARTLRHPRLRAGALAAVAGRAPRPLHSILLEEARRTSDEGGASSVLGVLAPALSPEGVETAVGIAAGLVEERWRAEAIVRLAPMLEGTSLRRALRIAYGVGDARSRARALASIAPRLPADEASAVAGIAARAFLRAAIHVRVDGDDVLAILPPLLSDHALAVVVEKVVALGIEQTRASGVALEAARRLSPPQLPMVLRASSSDDVCRAIVARISSGELGAFMRDETFPPDSVRPLLAAVPPDSLPGIALEVPVIPGYRVREAVLVECGRRSPQWGLPVVLPLLDHLESEYSRAWVLFSLASRYPVSPDDAVVRAAAGLTTSDLRTKVLALRVEQIPPDERRRAWLQAYDASQVLGDAKAAVQAVLRTNTACALDSSGWEPIMPLALRIFDTCRAEADAEDCLSLIGEHAPRAMWSGVLSRVRDLREPARARALSTLVAGLSREAAFPLVRSYLRREAQEPAPAGLLEEEVVVYRTALDEEFRAVMEPAFLSLAARDDEIIEVALAALPDCGDPRLREQLLGKMITSASVGLAPEVHRAIELVGSGMARSRLNDQLRHRLVREDLTRPEAPGGEEELEAVLNSAVARQESAVWEAAIERLARDGAVLGGREASEVVRRLAGCVPESLLSEAATVIRTLPDPWCQATGLAAVAARAQPTDQPARVGWEEVLLATASLGEEPGAHELRLDIVSAVPVSERTQLFESIDLGRSSILAFAAPYLSRKRLAREFRNAVELYAFEAKFRLQHSTLDEAIGGLDSSGLGPLLPLVDATDVAWAIEYAFSIPAPLAALLVPVLHEFGSAPQRLLVIEAAGRISEEEWRGKAAAAIGSRVEREDFAAARRLCLTLSTPAFRHPAFERLAARALPIGMHEEAADLIMMVSAEGADLSGWAKLLPLFGDGPPASLVRAWRALVRNLSRYPRDRLLDVLPEIILAGTRAQPGEGSAPFCEAVVQVVEWWP